MHDFPLLLLQYRKRGIEWDGRAGKGRKPIDDTAMFVSRDKLLAADKAVYEIGCAAAADRDGGPSGSRLAGRGVLYLRKTPPGRIPAMPKPNITSAMELEAMVRQMGFLPFFPCSIPDFSIEAFTPSRYWFVEGVDGSWEWRMELAYTYVDKGRFELLEKPKPILLDDRDAIVRVMLAGICASDLHIKHGGVPRAVPGITAGHEMVGIVEETGGAGSSGDPGCA